MSFSLNKLFSITLLFVALALAVPRCDSISNPNPFNTHALQLLRTQMLAQLPEQFDVYVVSTPVVVHGCNGEVACFARLRFLTGFSGCGGYAAITATEATLWVTSEYLAQVHICFMNIIINIIKCTVCMYIK